MEKKLATVNSKFLTANVLLVHRISLASRDMAKKTKWPWPWKQWPRWNKAIPSLKILKQRTREVLSERGDLKWSLTECETTDKADRRWHARQGKKLTVPPKALRHCLFAGAYRRDWREHLQNTMARSKLHHLQCLNRLNKTQRPFGSKWKIRRGL